MAFSAKLYHFKILILMHVMCKFVLKFVDFFENEAFVGLKSKLLRVIFLIILSQIWTKKLGFLFQALTDGIT